MSRQSLNRVGNIGTSNAVVTLLAIATTLLVGTWARAAGPEVLLDQTWADANRAENNLPAQSAVWIGRPVDVTVSAGVLSTKMAAMSQKIWTYFTPSEPVTLAVGQTLTASLTFIPRGNLYDNTSRSFRFGVFYDPSNPRVTRDTNSDSGGDDAPWTDATGYAVQLLLTNDPYTGTAAFDLGKRTDLADPSLLGTSSDFSKLPGGARVSEELDKEYTLRLAVKKVSDTQVDLTASLFQGDQKLATTTVRDNGVQLGAAPPYDKFDMLALRLSDNLTTADQIDVTRFKVTLEQ